MFVIKRNQIIILLLVCLIALSGYFNYVEMNNTEKQLALQEELTMEELEKNNGATTEVTDVSTKEQDIGTAVFVDNTFNEEAKETFFLQAKMNREQTRSQRKEWLTQVINNENVSTSKKNEATDELLELQNRIEKENAIESLIEAKGFSEVYVRIDEDTIDVVIDIEELSQQQISQIADIVNRKTGYPVSKIKISPLKTN